jgi:tRNA1(Val) A37 N6-methylase TrmN6
MNQDEETLDRFYHGKILVYQPRKGYRFSVDAPLLASFIKIEPEGWGCELGTGCGIIALLLSVRPFQAIVALEIQERLARLAQKNVRVNHLEEKIFIIQADIMSFYSRRKFNVVFANPPYFRATQGHLSPCEEKSIAKHEIKCDIMGIMVKAAELLDKRGRAYFIYPFSRKEEFEAARERACLKLNRIKLVYPRPGQAPRFFLAECSFQASTIEEMAPLFLLDEKGQVTPEAERIYAGRVDD